MMPKPHLGGLTVEETALKTNTVSREQVKRALETRWLGKLIERDSIEECLWLIHVRTSTYQYAPICG